MQPQKLILFLIYPVCACTHYPSAIDENFGKSVRTAVITQVVDSSAPDNFSVDASTDGRAMKSSIDRYQRSFEVIPLPTNVFNIGVGNSAGNSSGSSSTGR